MLIITNGDSAASWLAKAGVEASVLPWRDVLHEGPVPEALGLGELSDVRARFIAGSGWGDYDEVRRSFAERDAQLQGSLDDDEVVLWFEHDLYDQLQLVQLLDWFAREGRSVMSLSMICDAEYVGTVAPDRAHELLTTRHQVTEGELALGEAAWAAFGSPDPGHVEALVDSGATALPFLAAALRRHLEQYPWVGDGLSRSERQALAAIAAGRDTVREAFRAANHEAEDPIFLGDGVFVSYLENMSAGDGALLTMAEAENVFERRLSLTPLGEAVLDGRDDWYAHRGIDRWLGGVHLVGAEPRWRWDGEAGALRAML